MRGAYVAISLLAFTAPATATWDAGLTLLYARVDPLFEPAEELGSRHVIEFAVRNDAGGPERFQLILAQLWVVNSLPYGVWSEHHSFADGEVREYSLRVDYPLGDYILPHGPNWFCLEAGHTNDAYERCWSVWLGTAVPDGVYPETIPQAEYNVDGYGDTP